MKPDASQHEQAQLLSDVAGLHEEVERLKLEKHWLSDDYDRINSERAHLVRELEAAQAELATLRAAMKAAYGGHEHHETEGPVQGCPDCEGGGA